MEEPVNRELFQTEDKANKLQSDALCSWEDEQSNLISLYLQFPSSSSVGLQEVPSLYSPSPSASSFPGPCQNSSRVLPDKNRFDPFRDSYFNSDITCLWRTLMSSWVFLKQIEISLFFVLTSFISSAMPLVRVPNHRGWCHSTTC